MGINQYKKQAKVWLRETISDEENHLVVANATIIIRNNMHTTVQVIKVTKHGKYLSLNYAIVPKK